MKIKKNSSVEIRACFVTVSFRKLKNSKIAAKKMNGKKTKSCDGNQHIGKKGARLFV